jgi:glutaredoxin
MQEEPIKVYRRSWCEDSDAAVEYFQRAGVRYREVDIEEDGEAAKGVEFVTGGHHITPTLVYRMHAIVFDPWDEARFRRCWDLVNVSGDEGDKLPDGHD